VLVVSVITTGFVDYNHLHQASLPSSFRDYTNVPFVLDPVFIAFDDPGVFRDKYPVHAAALAGNALELRARLFPRVVGTERTGGGCDPASAMRPMSAAARKNRVIVDARDAVGWTAVHHASARGHLHCVAALVNAGADVEATTWTQGWSVVSLAAMYAHAHVLRFLLDKCVSTRTIDFSGRRPIEYAGKSAAVQSAFDYRPWNLPPR